MASENKMGLQGSKAKKQGGKKSKLIWAILLLIGAGGAALVWHVRRPISVTTIHPTHRPAVQAVYATGTVEASVTVRIASQSAGRILELQADEGHQVKAGTILARLDDRDFLASLAEAEARARYAQQQYERVDELVKRGWASNERLDEARAEKEAAHHKAQTVKEQMDFHLLRAPADGLIIRRDGEIGDYIPINQPVFYLAKSNEPLRITAEVDEEDVPLVKSGQRALIRTDAFPDKIIEGHVTSITPKGDAVARSYRVRIALPDNTSLLIGMTAEINIITREGSNSRFIPLAAFPESASQAVQRRSPSSTVWVLRDGHVQRQDVQTGIWGGEFVEIVSGLSDDDEVVIAPPRDLKLGQKANIRPLNASPSSITAAKMGGEK